VELGYKATPATKRSLVRRLKPRNLRQLALLISANIFRKRYIRRKSAWASVVVSESQRPTERSVSLVLSAIESKMNPIAVKKKKPTHLLKRKLWHN
jgi:hypothetical protein